ncbi:MAG: M20/M25/M40 family metallo-hydrolase [Planctomycetaceae bacterium]|nr:M20/M25/M40 family metallo-hydrolase [Planctomycetaceae bacterium]
MPRSLPLLLLVVLFSGGFPCVDRIQAADSRAETIRRVSDDIQYFASDELEGRGVETRGIELAAERILEEYVRHGLKPGLPDGSFRQPFDIAVGATAVADSTSALLNHSDGSVINLELGRQFQPLRRGADGKASAGLVFVGYGIQSREDDYDDYSGIDVRGKIVVMLRREPQSAERPAAFGGSSTTQHAYIETKLGLARKLGAVGIIFVNDWRTASNPNDDQLTEPSGFGSQSSGIPFVHVRQEVVNQILAKSPLVAGDGSAEKKLTSVQEVCEQIDSTLVPVSQPLPTWTATLQTHFSSKKVTACNLIGVLEAEGPLADETIVVGAHYDHLGRGGVGSRSMDRTGEIHNGADDNATGTAAVLEIIRRITAGKPLKRRVVFICFSGEERGLLGSRHYVDHPVIPLEKTVAMLNYDMIGTLRNNQVEVNGVGTAAEFRAIVEAADEASPLDIKVVENPFAGSDHLPFFQKEIPVMFCFTGVTPRYHTPDDDFEAINVEGVVSVIDYTEHLLRGIAALPKPPTFQPVSRSSRPRRSIPYLGVVPNIGADDGIDGIPLQSIRPDSPASSAGLAVGDVLLQANDTPLDGFSDLITFLGTVNAGQTVSFKVKRGEDTVSLNVKLGTPR